MENLDPQCRVSLHSSSAI